MSALCVFLRRAYTAQQYINDLNEPMQPRLYFVLLCAAATSTAYADIYKCVDESGHTTYMNDKPNANMTHCTLMTREQPVNTVPMQRKAAPSASANASSPAGFPKVDDATQKNRDSDRRKILEQELETEQKALETAKQELGQQEAVRKGDESNYQKFLDRIQPFKDKVALHERNIEAIRKEIGNLK